MKLRGRVHRVVLRGEVAYVEGQILVNPGFGQDIREIQRLAKSQVHPQAPTVDVISRPNSVLERLLSPNYEKLNGVQEISVETNDFSHLFQSGKGNVYSTSEVEARDSVKPTQRCISPLLSTVSKDQRIFNQLPPTVHLQNSHGLAGQHILTADMFSKEQLNDIFNTAQTLRLAVMKERSLDHFLRGKILASIFYEVSTRTSCSFSAAMLRLGGRVIHMDGTTSSVKKGETLEDTVAVMAGYADAVVLRHPEPSAVARAAQHCRKPMINAGDGVGEHPTQALLDIFTIREEIGTVNGLTITMVGDLKHGRTVHSLARLLTLYNVNLRYVSPPGLGMPEHVVSYVAQRGIPQEKFASLEEVLPDTDVLYMTRIQRERFLSQDEYNQVICLHFS